MRIYKAVAIPHPSCCLVLSSTPTTPNLITYISRTMTRTERASFPRAIIKDRAESKSGMDKSTPKQGAGTHNWGSLIDERELEEAADLDEENDLQEAGGKFCFTLVFLISLIILFKLERRLRPTARLKCSRRTLSLKKTGRRRGNSGRMR